MLQPPHLKPPRSRRQQALWVLVTVSLVGSGLLPLPYYFHHLLRPAKKQLEGACWGRLLGGGPPQNARTTGELPIYCDVVALRLWFLSCLLMVAVDVLFSTRGKRQLSDGLENNEVTRQSGEEWC